MRIWRPLLWCGTGMGRCVGSGGARIDGGCGYGDTVFWRGFGYGVRFGEGRERGNEGGVASR